jgi:predicted naringenin-chalcone synthase
MSLSILGLATALPEYTMSQVEATRLGQRVCCQTEEQSRLLRVLYRKSGVENRHTVVPHEIAVNWLEDGAEQGAVAIETSMGPTTLERMQNYEKHAAPLALTAARRALDAARVVPQDITHLVTVSCTGFYAPGVDIELIDGLRLPATTERVNVAFMGCHGAINGMRAARAITTADPQARVLMSAVELCSLHYRFQWDPEHFMGNALFADGSAAIVGGGPDSDLLRVTATGSCVLPDCKEAIGWKIGDYGFEMTLSARVPDLIKAHLRPWLDSWLEKHGTSVAKVGSWAIHPGGPRILSAVEETLNLGPVGAVSRKLLADLGNMSSPTVLFVVERLIRSQAPKPYVALAFGPGLTAEVALFE